MRKLLSTLLRGFISIFFIILLLYIMRDKYPQIMKTFASTKVPMFILGFLLFIGACLVASVRLRFLIVAQGIAVTLREAVSLTFIGYFFNNFLPTAIGGDVVKAYYLSHKTDNKGGHRYYVRRSWLTGAKSKSWRLTEWASGLLCISEPKPKDKDLTDISG